MGVEYDIHCKTCGGRAICGYYSKNLGAFREAIKIRSTLERWHAEDIDISLSIGHGLSLEPSFFARHKGHEPVVMGDNHVDYTRPDSDLPSKEPS